MSRKSRHLRGQLEEVGIKCDKEIESFAGTVGGGSVKEVEGFVGTVGGSRRDRRGRGLGHSVLTKEQGHGDTAGTERFDEGTAVLTGLETTFLPDDSQPRRPHIPPRRLPAGAHHDTSIGPMEVS